MVDLTGYIPLSPDQAAKLIGYLDGNVDITCGNAARMPMRQLKPCPECQQTPDQVDVHRDLEDATRWHFEPCGHRFAVLF